MGLFSNIFSQWMAQGWSNTAYSFYSCICPWFFADVDDCLFVYSKGYNENEQKNYKRVAKATFFFIIVLTFLAGLGIIKI